MRQVPSEEGLHACHCPIFIHHWLTFSGACSKDAAADEMDVSDAYELQVNVYTPFKAKAGVVEDVSSPKKKTPAQGLVPKTLQKNCQQTSFNSGKSDRSGRPRERGRTLQIVL